MQARCRDALFLFFLPLLFFSAGCRSNTGKLETELRTRDQLYREALEEQLRIESHNLSLRREVDALRQGGKGTPEQPVSTSGVKRIVLGRATGGVDQDNIPGDELLQVIVEPRDSEDHAFKAPGILQVYALEITPQGIKTPLCMWDIPPDKLQQSWKTGLLSTGYTLTLPWKVLPVLENVRIVVHFVALDQRAFEADKDIKVRLVPGALQKRAQVIPEGMPMPTHDRGPILLPMGTTSSSSWLRAPAEAPAPHRTEWRPVSPPAEVAVGRPEPLD